MILWPLLVRSLGPLGLLQLPCKPLLLLCARGLVIRGLSVCAWRAYLPFGGTRSGKLPTLGLSMARMLA